MTSPSIKEPNSTKVSVSQIWMLTTAVLVVAAFLGVWFLFDGKHNTNWALLLFLSTLTGYFFNDMLLKKIPRSIYRGFLWGAALSVLLIGGEILYQNNLHPKVWDFSCFYLDGQVIASGRDLYNPESYKRTFEEIELPTELQIGEKLSRSSGQHRLQVLPTRYQLFHAASWIELYTGSTGMDRDEPICPVGGNHSGL